MTAVTQIPHLTFWLFRSRLGIAQASLALFSARTSIGICILGVASREIIQIYSNLFKSFKSFKSYKSLLQQLHFVNDTCLGVVVIPFGIKTFVTEIDKHAERQVR